MVFSFSQSFYRKDDIIQYFATKTETIAKIAKNMW